MVTHKKFPDQIKLEETFLLLDFLISLRKTFSVNMANFVLREILELLAK